VAHVAESGHLLTDGLARTVEAGDDETVWRLRRFVGDQEKIHLAFASARNSRTCRA